ncbi:HdeA/HdeB family chaperone [Pleurocapsa sp. CCALA 161]|uniref:HdeA/HdeB family chaperone n=1 Tax=Pleurocapsa sp. CCALA 161 TaxID=2107688 RepID=UPI0021009317|nr:HdeA/HdeB family chaperone [Pleurocapsa sp. CCALA 161]
MFLVITTRVANSSEEIDMSQLTCTEFLAMDRMPQVMSLVWYNGFAAQKRGTFVFTPDRDNLSEQKDSLTTACEASGNDLVVEQLPTIFSY